MSPPLQRIRHALFGDDLFARVMMFMTGALILAVPILAAVFGILNGSADPALLILLAVSTAFSSFLIYASIRGSPHLIEKACTWADSGEIAIVLGLITFAIPITLLIKYFRGKQ